MHRDNIAKDCRPVQLARFVRLLISNMSCLGRQVLAKWLDWSCADFLSYFAARRARRWSVSLDSLPLGHPISEGSFNFGGLGTGLCNI